MRQAAVQVQRCQRLDKLLAAASAGVIFYSRDSTVVFTSVVAALSSERAGFLNFEFPAVTTIWIF
jgi:hypothetical protein